MLYCFFHNFTIRAIEGGKDPTRAPYREQEIGKRFVQIVHRHFQTLRSMWKALLLSGTNLPIFEVTRQCGLPDKTHFYTIIRKSVGMSPTEYREQEQQAK